ncbi:General transcription factor IIH subunit 5 [Microtus ochrogaster]|uniref:General transcription and DNA repair factor IIH subunit TFB5 n=1 Tax=Microtus ochrogaster TaxID=79684 RepID=A0A8J6H0L9_MICOH|nr:General transcription factor IIH subunit 5 [Microtus ochrogaster]
MTRYGAGTVGRRRHNVFCTCGRRRAAGSEQLGEVGCVGLIGKKGGEEAKRHGASRDPAMKQFLLYLDESNALGKKFIIQDIDDTHVFVIAELVNVLQERVGELMDQNAFSLTQK